MKYLSLLVLSACTAAPILTTTPSEVVATPTPATVPVTEQLTRVSLTKLTGASATERTKLSIAARAAEVVLNSPEFRKRILEFKFQDDSKLSNEAIYKRIREGAEKLKPETNYQADLELSLYTPPFYKKWTVVGYTYVTTPVQWMNRYYFNKFSAPQIAGNLVHEWTHKLGFGHDFKSTKRRPFSVPYAVGDIVAELAAGVKDSS